jgi:hypothetical protein
MPSTGEAKTVLVISTNSIFTEKDPWTRNFKRAQILGNSLQSAPHLEAFFFSHFIYPESREEFLCNGIIFNSKTCCQKLLFGGRYGTQPTSRQGEVLSGAICYF